MAEKTIFLEPIKGKYVSLTLDGRKIEIFKVDPRGDGESYGTEVDYADATRILTIYGKSVRVSVRSQKDLDDTIKATIAAERERLTRGLVAKSTVAPQTNVDNSALENRVKNQDALIAAQTEQLKQATESNAALAKQLEEMKAQMVEMQKTIASTSDSKKTSTKKTEEENK